MASRQQKKEGEKSKTNLVKREAKIDATFTQKLITSPFSQGWNHLDALWAARLLLLLWKQTAPHLLCYPGLVFLTALCHLWSLGFCTGNLESFLKYLPPDDFKSSTTGFNPLHEILFYQRKTNFQQIKQMPDLKYSCAFSFSSGEAMSDVWKCLLPEWSLLLSGCMRVMDRSQMCTFLTWRKKHPQNGELRIRQAAT